MRSKPTIGRLARITATGMTAAALLGPIAACTEQPWMLSQSPEAVVVRWYPDESDIAAATKRAEAYCRYWGKSAQLASDLRDGSAEVAQYRCR